MVLLMHCSRQQITTKNKTCFPLSENTCFMNFHYYNNNKWNNKNDHLPSAGLTKSKSKPKPEPEPEPEPELAKDDNLYKSSQNNENDSLIDLVKKIFVNNNFPKHDFYKKYDINTKTELTRDKYSESEIISALYNILDIPNKGNPYHILSIPYFLNINVNGKTSIEDATFKDHTKEIDKIKKSYSVKNRQYSKLQVLELCYWLIDNKKAIIMNSEKAKQSSTGIQLLIDSTIETIEGLTNTYKKEKNNLNYTNRLNKQDDKNNKNDDDDDDDDIKIDEFINESLLDNCLHFIEEEDKYNEKAAKLMNHYLDIIKDTGTSNENNTEISNENNTETNRTVDGFIDYVQGIISNYSDNNSESNDTDFKYDDEKDRDNLLQNIFEESDLMNNSTMRNDFYKKYTYSYDKLEKESYSLSEIMCALNNILIIDNDRYKNKYSLQFFLDKCNVFGFDLKTLDEKFIKPQFIREYNTSTVYKSLDVFQNIDNKNYKKKDLIYHIIDTYSRVYQKYNNKLGKTNPKKGGYAKLVYSKQDVEQLIYSIATRKRLEYLFKC